MAPDAVVERAAASACSRRRRWRPRLRARARQRARARRRSRSPSSAAGVTARSAAPSQSIVGRRVRPPRPRRRAIARVRPSESGAWTTSASVNSSHSPARRASPPASRPTACRPSPAGSGPPGSTRTRGIVAGGRRARPRAVPSRGLVVHDDHLDVAVVERAQAADRRADAALLVARGHDHAHQRAGRGRRLVVGPRGDAALVHGERGGAGPQRRGRRRRRGSIVVAHAREGSARRVRLGR